MSHDVTSQEAFDVKWKIPNSTFKRDSPSQLRPEPARHYPTPWWHNVHTASGEQCCLATRKVGDCLVLRSSTLVWEFSILRSACYQGFPICPRGPPITLVSISKYITGRYWSWLNIQCTMPNVNLHLNLFTFFSIYIHYKYKTVNIVNFMYFVKLGNLLGSVYFAVEVKLNQTQRHWTPRL